MMSRSINSHSSQQLYQQGSPINTSFSFGSMTSSSGNGNNNCTSTNNGNGNGYTSPVLARAHPHHHSSSSTRRGSSFRANANVNLNTSSLNNSNTQHVGGSVSPLHQFQNSLSHSNSIHSQHNNNNSITGITLPNKKFTLDVTSQSSDSELDNDVSSGQLSFDAAITKSQSHSHHHNNNNNRSNSTHSISASTSSVPKSALVGLSRRSSVQMGNSGSAAAVGKANSLIDDVVQRNSSEDEASFITVGDGLTAFRG
ncbi:unnamed protein product [Ambrosiozyma monospora]|uniref:Unnamed protein product n=1 Tax=Ambrosiozyma monospora TaxID=43982 RepID=A0ACB5T7E9_AMBMO|nr:unnamed protein product [Ambrosiozyma monospora]